MAGRADERAAGTITERVVPILAGVAVLAVLVTAQVSGAASQESQGKPPAATAPGSPAATPSVVIGAVSSPVDQTVRVVLENSDSGQWGRWAEADVTDGTFRFDLDTPGDYRVRAVGSVSGTAISEPFRLDGGTTEDVELALPEPATVRGVVRTSRGEVARNVSFTLASEFFAPPRGGASPLRTVAVTTDGAGRYSALLAPGQWQAVMDEGCYADPERVDLTVAAGETASQDLVRDAPGALTGVVSRPELPQAEVTVNVEPVQGKTCGQQVLVRPDGRWRAAGLQTGRYLISYVVNTDSGVQYRYYHPALEAPHRSQIMSVIAGGITVGIDTRLP